MSAVEITESLAETKAHLADSAMDEDHEYEDNKAEALACLMEGKRNMLCKDIPAAVSCLAEACELMTAECGEKAPECGEAYYFYGKALLEMARLENVVLGIALSGVTHEEDCVKEVTQVEDPDLMTEEERTDVEEKVNEALTENFENCEIAESPLLKKDTKLDGVISSPIDPDLPSGETAEKGKEKASEDDEAEEDSDDECDIDEEKAEAKAEEDPTSLQLAWEVLELSKLICKEQLEAGDKKNHTSETKAGLEKRYCETFLLLSEVSVESGNYQQAVEDLKVCLERQKRLLPADSRNIAETLYHLGVALGFHKNYDEAFMSLDAAISVLILRLDNLKEKTGSVAKNEATEIKALLPEVKAKVADLKDMKVETDRKTSELYHIGGKETTSSSSKPVSTIPVKKIECA